MIYQYKLKNNKIISVFVSNDDFSTVVDIYEKNKTIELKIKSDNNNNKKYFVYKKEKVYLDNWIKSSMKELKEKVDQGKKIYSDELCRAILSDGVNNVRFLAPFNVVQASFLGISLLDGSNFEFVKARIVEEFNREIKNNYKIKLIPEEQNENISSSHDFYTSDFAQLINNGVIKIIL